jgi:2-amino-4-hydroxy-6-hydroxymethyldihydropteridine diphosphokinase
MPSNSTSYIAFSIGANLGDRLISMKRAISLLSESITDLQCSSVYETEPVGYNNQPVFLNCAICGYTDKSPEHHIEICKSIEYTIGRQSRPKWHEREIDIDIVLFEDCILDSEDIAIPHPRMHLRAFVLQPLSDISPDRIHPVLKKNIKQLLSECTDTAEIKVFGKPTLLML